MFNCDCPCMCDQNVPLRWPLGRSYVRLVSEEPVRQSLSWTSGCFICTSAAGRRPPGQAAAAGNGPLTFHTLLLVAAWQAEADRDFLPASPPGGSTRWKQASEAPAGEAWCLTGANLVQEAGGHASADWWAPARAERHKHPVVASFHGKRLGDRSEGVAAWV